MHSMKLEVNESTYLQVFSFINKFQADEVDRVENIEQEDYVVSSIEVVKKEFFMLKLMAR